MKNCNRWHAAKLALFFSVLGNVCFAQSNPVVQTKYTADPAPFVYKDTVFLYTTHDEDDAQGFKMLNWLLYTSTDMANWTDRGIVASLDDFSWGTKGNGAWALQVIERDGKFYMYCPMHGKGLGVLVADNPYGPFKDPLNKRLIETDHPWNDIDPSPFIDDDGQAYLYWGNPDLYCVKLNKDMISYSGEVIKVASKPANYQEGPWVWKREGHYYLAYASTCCPEGIGYAMSTSPLGPWEYKGMVMDATKRSNGNHPGIIDYKGKSYTFGLNYELLRKISPDHSERRSVAVGEMTYNADGTIQTLPFWLPEGVAQVVNFNPFRRVEAETIAWAEGLKTERNPVSGMYVTNVDNNDYLKVRGVDFGKGAKKFEASLASVKAGSKIEIRIDSLNGPLISVCEVKPSGDLNKWSTSLSKLKKTTKVHDVYFVFKGEGSELFKFDWWRFH